MKHSAMHITPTKTIEIGVEKQVAIRIQGAPIDGYLAATLSQWQGGG